VDPLDSEAIGQAMLEIAGSSELRTHLRNAGLKRAAQFSWEWTAEKTIEVFDQISHARPSSRSAPGA
jgi:glycosyltransferase involved in cell wall biosynthesis